MATTIKLKNSVTTTNAPSSLVQGEVAINITDKKVWVGNAATTPIQLLGDGGSASFTSIAFGAGTVSNPSITFTGDTNTGIYSPAADTIAFTEGGVESMRIDSSGNVGIGTSSPGRKLHVNGDIRTVNCLIEDSGTNVNFGTFTAGYLGLQANGSERMRIDSSGNVIVGGTSTSVKFDVQGTGVLASRILNTSTSATQYAIMQVKQGNSSTWQMFVGDNDNKLKFGQSGVGDNLIIDSSGNVGIGTSSPAQRLHVASSSSTYIQIQNTGNSVNAYYGVDTAGGWMGTSTNHYAAFYTNNTERMRITSGGDLVVGDTTSGGYAISARRVNDNCLMRLTAVTAGGAGIDLVNAGGSEVSYINAGGSNVLVARTGGTERMRITSGGYLLVGTTSTANQHRIVGSASGLWALVVQNNISSNPFGQVIQYENSAPNGTGNQFLYCGDSVTVRAEIRSNGGFANYSGNDVNLSDEREKTNIQLAGSYLDKICAIPVKTFNYIDQNREEDDGLTLGVIAQDVQAVAPELVMESDWSAKKDGSKMRLSIYQTDLQYALMKCIQEQQAMIEELKQEVAKLKGV